MSPLDRIESYAFAHERQIRRGAAAAMTAWLLGWGPTIAFTDNWPGRHGPQLYAWWIILLPLIVTCLAMMAVGLWCFYAWALGGPPREVLEQRIAELERELGIPMSKFPHAKTPGKYDCLFCGFPTNHPSHTCPAHRDLAEPIEGLDAPLYDDVEPEPDAHRS